MCRFFFKKLAHNSFFYKLSFLRFLSFVFPFWKTAFYLKINLQKDGHDARLCGGANEYRLQRSRASGEALAILCCGRNKLASFAFASYRPLRFCYVVPSTGAEVFHVASPREIVSRCLVLDAAHFVILLNPFLFRPLNGYFAFNIFSSGGRDQCCDLFFFERTTSKNKNGLRHVCETCPKIKKTRIYGFLIIKELPKKKKKTKKQQKTFV